MVGNTPIKRLHTGTLWAEGPAWNGVGRYLIWSDIPNNVQMRWIEEDGHVTVFRNPSGNSNGNTFDYEGRQLSCEHGGRRVVRYEPSGAVTVIADKYQGKRLNSPNDIVVHPDGGIWFTDPTYGIRGNYEGFKADSETKEAVYRVDSKTGQMEKVTDQPNQPNGLCFSPDESLLYINDTEHAHIRVFDVGSDHRLSGSRVFAENIGDGDLAKGGLVDGMKLDEHGNVYVTGPEGVWVFSPEGEHLGTIEVPESTGNMNWGDDDWRSLFIPASTSVYRVRMKVAGNRLGYMH